MLAKAVQPMHPVELLPYPSAWLPGVRCTPQQLWWGRSHFGPRETEWLGKGVSRGDAQKQQDNQVRVWREVDTGARNSVTE